MKLRSVPKIFSQSRVSATNLLPCQNGYRPFLHLFAKFCMMWVFNHNWMTIVTLQTNYDPTLPGRYPKVAYPLENSSGSKMYSDTCQSPHNDSESIDLLRRCLLTVMSSGSRESLDGRHDTPFIFRILKYFLPQNSRLFITTTCLPI